MNSGPKTRKLLPAHIASVYARKLLGQMNGSIQEAAIALKNGDPDSWDVASDEFTTHPSDLGDIPETLKDFEFARKS